MKKYALLVICCAGMACAANYNPLTDWVDYPGSPASWRFGGRIETGYGTGVFGNLIEGTHSPDIAGFIDGWTVANTYGTCGIWKIDPWQAKSGPVMNAWTTYQATARLTPEAGIYDITGNFWGTGYANPSVQFTNVYIVKNGSEVLWQGYIFDYTNKATFALTDVTLNAGDYVDFISGNGAPVGESRTALTADVTFVSGLSECTVMLPADLSHDCVVNLEDFAALGLQWLISTDYDDLDTLSRQWLECTRSSDPDCWPYIESAMAGQWIEQAFTGATPQPPFSFIYNSVSSASFLSTWNFSRSSTVLDANRTQWVLVYTEPGGPLKVTCQATEYHDYPAVEWVMNFENIGTANTPIIKDVKACNTTFSSSSGFLLDYSRGSTAIIQDFEPLQTTLAAGSTFSLGNVGGRSSDTYMPFFNIEQGTTQGCQLAIGWTGQWKASFIRDNSINLTVEAGLDPTAGITPSVPFQFVLEAGEKVRMPLMLLNFWAGDGDRARNQFRRLLRSHYTPRPDGNAVQNVTASSVSGSLPNGFTSVTQTNAKTYITELVNANPRWPVDYFWIDAGWYTATDWDPANDWARGVGNWLYDPETRPDCSDPTRFPGGLTGGIKNVADYAHSCNYKFLLWFEPERIMGGKTGTPYDTSLYTLCNTTYPDWMIKPSSTWPTIYPSWGYMYYDGFNLLDLGNPQALVWAKDHFSTLVNNIGVDIYRNDFNMYPLPYWQKKDSSSRRGITEMKYIAGLYDYFDTLLADKPGLIIDNCASGGRRLDIEMLKRSVPLTTSDLLWDPTAQQCQNYGVSLWIPAGGVGSVSPSEYNWRSGMGVNFCDALHHDAGGVWKSARTLLNQLNQIKQLYFCDFYPMTPFNTADDVWMAWQYDSPETGEGLLQAFRRPNNTTGSMVFKLKGLEENATYTINGTTTATGSDLMNTGLAVNLPVAGSSAIIAYSKN